MQLDNVYCNICNFLAGAYRVSHQTIIHIRANGWPTMQAMQRRKMRPGWK